MTDRESPIPTAVSFNFRKDAHMNAAHAAHAARTAAALLLVGALSGCGSDNLMSNSNPNSSLPSPPSNLRFDRSLLTWDASADTRVVGYEIEADLPDQQVAFVPINLRMSSITAYDLAVDRLEYINTWYRVRAVNGAGVRSNPSNSVFVTVSSGGLPIVDDPGLVNAGPINP